MSCGDNVNFRSIQVRFRYPFSVPRCAVKLSLFVGYCVWLVAMLAGIAAKGEQNGVSPQYLGWFTYVAFLIVSFVAFGFVGYVGLTLLVNEAFDLWRRLWKKQKT